MTLPPMPEIGDVRGLLDAQLLLVIRRKNWHLLVVARAPACSIKPLVESGQPAASSREAAVIRHREEKGSDA